MSAFWDSGTGGPAAVPSSSGTDLLGKAGKAAKDDSKITKAAKDFEAILLGSWFQQAEETFAKMPGSDEDDEDGGGSQFMGMAMQSLGSSIAAGGGIGIAKMISEKLQKTVGAKEVDAVSAGSPADAGEQGPAAGTQPLPGLNRRQTLPIK